MPVRMWRSDHFQLNALDMCSVFPGGQGSVTRLQHVSVSAQCGLTWVPDHIPSDTCQLCDHSHVYFIMETLHSTKFKQWKPMYSNGECLIQSLPSSTTLIYYTQSKHNTLRYLYESMGVGVHTGRKLDCISTRWCTHIGLEKAV